MLRRILLLTVLLAPLVAGQFGLAQISIRADAQDAAVDVGSSVVVPLEVSNPATAGPDLQVVVEVTELPTGWGASLDQGQFSLASGESQTVHLTLIPTDHADLGKAAFTVQARGRYQVDPLGQTVDEATDEAKFSVALRPAPTQPTDWIPAWLLPVLIVAAAAALGFAAWGTRRGIRLRPASRRLEAPEGTLAVLPVRIRNASGKTQRVSLSLACDDDTWHPGVAPESLQLAPGEEQEVELQAIVPTEAGRGCRVTLRAEADSGRRSRTKVRFGLRPPAPEAAA